MDRGEVLVDERHKSDQWCVVGDEGWWEVGRGVTVDQERADERV